MSETGEPSKVATPERPQYSKFPQDQFDVLGTQLWAINVDEGWRSWILCCDMYECVADQLLERLRADKGGWKCP